MIKSKIDPSWIPLANIINRPVKKFKYIIGIDPGVNTGVCVWITETRCIRHLSDAKIHDAMEIVKWFKENNPGDVFVRVEDARKRTWFGKAGPGQLQGAGSIKRDCKIWEDFLESMHIEFEMVAPKNNITKLDAKRFKMISKYDGRTTEHSRDAAMLVIGL
jgi:hypothetical protein